MKKLLFAIAVVGFTHVTWTMDHIEQIDDTELQTYIREHKWDDVAFHISTGQLSVDRILQCNMDQRDNKNMTLPECIVENGYFYQKWHEDPSKSSSEVYGQRAERASACIKTLLRTGKITTQPEFRDSSLAEETLRFYHGVAAQVPTHPQPKRWMFGSGVVGVILSMLAWKYYRTEQKVRGESLDDETDEQGTVGDIT